MKIKTFGEMIIGISADDLAALLYRARQADIFYREKSADEAKITRLKRVVTDLGIKVQNQRKEVIEMPVKWTKPKTAGNKPKAEKPKGKKEAK